MDSMLELDLGILSVLGRSETGMSLDALRDHSVVSQRLLWALQDRPSQWHRLPADLLAERVRMLAHEGAVRQDTYTGRWFRVGCASV